MITKLNRNQTNSLQMWPEKINKVQVTTVLNLSQMLGSTPDTIRSLARTIFLIPVFTK